MDPWIFFGVLIAIYGVLLFFDRFFKSCMHYPYEAFLTNTGLTVGLFHLKWHTTAFNRWVLRLGNNSGNCCRQLINKSFTVGVLVALSLVPVGIILLFITIFGGGGGSGKETDVNNFATGGAANVVKSQGINVEILLPGVNLPLEEIGYYVATLLISTVIHELGHALAAVMEDIPVTGFGFHLYFCLPVAYTEISTDHLNALKWLKKLRILCAGIWHNFVFAGLCYLLLSTMSFMASPLYSLNKNVIVTQVTAQSPLRAKGDRGLVEGNVITHINDCPVSNEDTWYNCLVNSLHFPGFCVSSDFIRLNDESIEIAHHSSDGTLQCCGNNAKLCCFEYIDDFNNDAPVEIPQHVCLDVRRTMEDSYGYCTASGTCERGFCLRPLLKNTTTIMIFKRQSLKAQDAPLKNVIYMGHPLDVTRSIRISQYVPKHEYINPKWCDNFILFLKYNIVFSLGLALINAIPCFGFDGNAIVNTIVNSFLVNRITEKAKRDVVSLIATGIGSLLFLLAVTKVLWISLLRYLF
ncbi:membrane-bound transcription factor site-2 protease [Musca domestica]|uniref:Membrane-bound transcription factor site-2 protease n=1 Tax=Musca domestica TaxID=7370 RepID=A0A9J7I692_MUSDO|nr:membrane-bound transcription factor site-2 protease [Musca domestica]